MPNKETLAAYSLGALGFTYGVYKIFLLQPVQNAILKQIEKRVDFEALEQHIGETALMMFGEQE